MIDCSTYVKGVGASDVALLETIEIGASPIVPAGVTALTTVGDRTCRLVQFTPPIFTAVVPERLVPLIVI